MAGTPTPMSISTRLQRIAELARRMPDVALRTLAHHIDVAFLHEAFRRTRKDGAPGVDGKTAEEYEANLRANLEALLDRFKSGQYRAPPVRRVHIPKGKGKTRPIGIPTIEDKILQRAVTMVLEAVYEQDFLPCSFGFRPRRSAHDALEALWKGTMDMGGGWVLELDIQSFFDDLDHEQLRSFLDQRVRDGVIRRAIGKWLNAGVLEEGNIRRPKTGSPQGGVISPLLANIYLHEVLDKWFEEEVKPRMRGRAFLIRYADDATLVFSDEGDARRVFDVLPKRFGKYGLTLHPEKTRLVDFRRPSERGKDEDDSPRRGGRTFPLLGFTHYWGRSRKGRWVVKKKTSSQSLSRALTAIGAWCRRMRHQPVWWQWRQLAPKLRGHYAYFGVIGNSRALASFRYWVVAIWRKWLSRRSQRGRVTWERHGAILARYPLPWPRMSAHANRRAAKP